MKLKTGRIIKLSKCKPFTSGDGCRLREMLHAAKSGAAIRYSLAHATVRPGVTTLPHRLRTSEVYYILSGRGRMHIDSLSKPVGPGDTVYIPPHARQCITNTGRGKLAFICIVDPAWRAQDEEIF
ncbi:MAG: cupin domain-containing protein [Elusimicrobia bacterium]|nr:cupin domain-containing protein [Elusimicrobiota bacterium]